MFALGTMANGGYIGVNGNSVFLEVTSACRQEYSDFVETLWAVIRREGRISPKMPAMLRRLIDDGLDVKALLEKYPLIPPPPMKPA